MLIIKVVHLFLHTYISEIPGAETVLSNLLCASYVSILLLMHLVGHSAFPLRL